MDLKEVLVNAFYKEATPAIPRENVELVIGAILPKVCGLLNDLSGRFPLGKNNGEWLKCPHCGQGLLLTRG